MGDGRAARLRVFLLGGFVIERDETVLPDAVWVRRKSKALVKLLALAPGQRLHREQLQDLLWPELDPDGASRNLRKVLHVARQVLEPDRAHGAASRYLLSQGDMLTLGECWVDAGTFELVVREGLESGDQSVLEEAIRLYRGPLLPEDLYEEWTMQRRNMLEQLALQAGTRLADILEVGGKYGAAITHLHDAVDRDRTREELHRRLMRLYTLAGSRHAALRQYQVVREALAEDLGAEPDTETEELYAAIRAGSHAPPATAASPAASPAVSPAAHWLPHLLPPTLPHLPTTPFVGRERALEVLFHELDGGRQSEGNEDRRQATLIGGEAGVGKTRLLTELAHGAAERGWRVLWGASYGPEGQTPYGPFVDLLESAVTTLPGDERAALRESYPELSRLLPRLAVESATAPKRLDSRSDQTRLFAAIARFLGELAAAHPLLLVLDDLHTADSASLQLLHQLMRQGAVHGWFLVGAYREEDVERGSPLALLLAAVRRSRLARQIELLRLPRDASDRLVTALLSGGAPQPPILAHIFALAEGNALFTTELLHSLQEAEELTLVDGTWSLQTSAPFHSTASVPQQVRDLVESRVHALGEEVGRALALMAVAGMETRFEVLAEAAEEAYPEELSEHRLLDALDRALEARVLEERGQAYAFRHPLFREALYVRLSARRRARLHLALGQAIEGLRPDDSEALVYHFSHSTATERAVHYLWDAATRAERLYAWEIAESHIRILIDLLDRNGRKTESARARLHLSTICLTTQRFAEAVQACEQARDIFRRAGDGAGEVDALWQLAANLLDEGNVDSAGTVVQEAIDTAQAQRTGEAASPQLHVQLGRILFAQCRFPQGLAAMRRAVEHALAAGDADAISKAYGGLGWALIGHGFHREACTVIANDLPRLRAVGHRRTLSLQLGNLGEAYYMVGEVDRSVSLCRESLIALEEMGDVLFLGVLISVLGHKLFVLGRWEEARRYVDRGLKLYEGRETSEIQAMTRVFRGIVSFGQGQWEAAREDLQVVCDSTQRWGDFRWHRDAQIYLAQCDLGEGRAEVARDRLQTFTSRSALLDLHIVPALPYLALAHLALGNSACAGAIMADATTRARNLDAPPYLADVLRVQGIVQAALGRTATAEEAFAEALTIARAMPYPWLEGRTLLAQGDALTRAGGIDQGQDLLGAARAIFERLGAGEDLARAMATLSAVLRS